jgi:hypothetical protein
MRSPVTMAFPLLLCLLAAAPAPDAGDGQRRGRDQAMAWTARREGRVLPLAEIERRVVPTVRGADYLGVDFDGGTGIYTLKFLRDGQVIWVDVDGRSGQVIGRTGR